MSMHLFYPYKWQWHPWTTVSVTQKEEEAAEKEGNM